MTNLVERSNSPTERADGVHRPETDVWVEICAVSRVQPDRGVAALVGGHPVAVFRLGSTSDLPEEWFAVDHLDPRTGAPVMARGLVGSTIVDGAICPTVASPLHKQRYDLRTGEGLDGESTRLGTWPIQIHDGRVFIAAP